MKITKTKLKKAIDVLEAQYDGKGGNKPILFDPVVKESFIKAVVVHSLDCHAILQSMRQDDTKTTKRQVYTYLRQIFGPYKKMGRPSLYVDNGSERDQSKALYL